MKSISFACSIASQSKRNRQQEAVSRSAAKTLVIDNSANECRECEAEPKGFTTMLVLSRKEGQQILVGEDVVLTITQIRGNRVKVGISAPRDVSVKRVESVEMEESVDTPLVFDYCSSSAEVAAR